MSEPRAVATGSSSFAELLGPVATAGVLKRTAEIEGFSRVPVASSSLIGPLRGREAFSLLGKARAQ
ncbi:MAG: hypothetical protein DMF74_28785 [Acidobacteria bacterium]|nr:MAG: hypothetical protein DMF74_28785 [Acidobacteriota bacterium]